MKKPCYIIQVLLLLLFCKIEIILISFFFLFIVDRHSNASQEQKIINEKKFKEITQAYRKLTEK